MPSSSSVMPITPLSGVRISWLMLARNSLLARLAASACSLARSSSSRERTRRTMSLNARASSPNSSRRSARRTRSRSPPATRRTPCTNSRTGRVTAPLSTKLARAATAKPPAMIANRSRETRRSAASASARLLWTASPRRPGPSRGPRAAPGRSGRGRRPARGRRGAGLPTGGVVRRRQLRPRRRREAARDRPAFGQELTWQPWLRPRSAASASVSGDAMTSAPSIWGGAPLRPTSKTSGTPRRGRSARPTPTGRRHRGSGRPSGRPRAVRTAGSPSFLPAANATDIRQVFKARPGGAVVLRHQASPGRPGRTRS